MDVTWITHLGNRSLVVDVAMGPGDRVSISWNGVSKNHACGTYFYGVTFGNNAGGSSGEHDYAPGVVSGTVSFVSPGFGTQFSFDAFADGYCSDGQLHNVTWQILPPEAGYCGYGTRAKAGLDLALYITPELLSVAFAAVAMEFLVPIMGVFLFTTIVLVDVCNHGVPPMPTIDLSTASASFETARQILYAVLWSQYCECIPGTPTPTSPPLPGQPQPTGWPPAPTFGCDNVDPCAALVAIQDQLLAIARVVGADLGLTTLIQRARLPYASIQGFALGGRSGSGTLVIERILGVRVDIENMGANRELEGNPPYVWDLGWLSITDGGGMLQEVRITRTSQTWYPQQAQLGTTLGYFFKAGVSGRITTLLPEP